MKASITLSLLGTMILRSSNAQCQVGDTLFTPGQSTSFIGLECINSTSFDASTSKCGSDGQIIDENKIMTCDESAPYCMQCGPRGWGAALCLSTQDLDNRDCGGEEPDEVTVAYVDTNIDTLVDDTDGACVANAICTEEGSTCTNGETETCCGETYPSFQCECSNGTYGCLYTERCMLPSCETETGSNIVSGIIEGIDTNIDTLVDDTDGACVANAICTEEDSTCTNGQTETCCGETYPSFQCECSNGTYQCYYTDRCMHPSCETETGSTIVSGIIEDIVIEGIDSSLDGIVQTDGDSNGDTSDQTEDIDEDLFETHDSSANGLCVWEMVVVSVFSIGVSMMLA